MKISIEVMLKDVPGQLAGVLGALEESSCNVQSIVHFRDRKNKNNEVPVQILLETASAKQVERLKENLASRFIAVNSVGEIKSLQSATVGLVGHLVQSKSVEKIITELDATGVNVSDIKVTMPSQETESSALVTVESESAEKISHAVALLRKICAEKNLLLVEAL